MDSRHFGRFSIWKRDSTLGRCMGRHNARPRRGRMIPVLGTSCGLLAAAAFTGGVRPAIALPDAGSTPVAIARGAAESASDEASLIPAGPLQMPEIGVVAPGFDERYAALLSASHTTPAPSPAPRPAPRWPTPTPEATTPAPPSAPAPTSPPAPPPPPPPPAEEPPGEEPPGEEPPGEEPPAERPPSEEPPPEPPPAEEPPPEEPPAEEPEEPAEEPVEDVELALGETFDVLDASGQLVYTVAVDAVVPDVECTADESLPAANGHLIGVQLRVLTGPAPAEGTDPPAISATDFGYLGADDQPGADAHTTSAAACLDEAEDFPSGPLAPEQETAGTIVLDVADVTGAIAYRPEGLSLFWRF